MMSTNDMVHLIDDDKDLRQALAFLLGTAGLAVRVYESAVQFLESYSNSMTGCVVSDVRMPGMNGLELLQRLKELGVKLPVVIMTGHADIALAVEAMKAGAADFIEKPFSDDKLLGTIRSAMTRYENSQLDEGTEQVRLRLATLTPREHDVLQAVLAGHSNKAIANDLGLSPRTVEAHRANLMYKMAADSLPELVRMTLSAS